MTNYDLFEQAVAQDINRLQEEIREWADDVKTRPSYHLSWGDRAFRNAAELAIYTRLKTALSSDTPISEIADRLGSELSEQSMDVPHSTSPTSNIMANETRAALARIVQTLRSLAEPKEQ